MNFTKITFKTKLIIYFLVIFFAFTGVAIREYAIFRKITIKKTDIVKGNELRSSIKDLKNLILQDRLFLMEIIAPSTAEEYTEAWSKHLDLQKEYMAQYSHAESILLDETWGEGIKDEKRKILYILQSCHSYFVNSLAPAVEDINDWSGQILKLRSNYIENQSEIEYRTHLIHTRDMSVDDEGVLINADIVDQIQLTETILENTKKEIENLLKREQVYTFLTAFLIILLAFSLTIILLRSILSPLDKLTKAINHFSLGKIDVKLDVEREDEVGVITKALAGYQESLKKVSLFAHKIGNEEYDDQFTVLSEEDELGNALLSMRDKLKSAKLIQIEQKEKDKKNNWSTEGIALFSQILRRNNDDLNELSYSLLSNLVKYVSAQLGALYFLNDENEKVLDQTAAFAFERQKHISTQIEVGEGLVGNCFLERKTIYIKEIPDGYLKITSGMGQAEPNVLLLVPMIYNEEIHGVIELSSFNDFDETKVDFIEKVGELTAATLLNIRMNMQTKRLLEETKMQAERVQQQEEEMRQSLEEMRATQEESKRREEELISRLGKYEKR